ncbi:branched-chain amino acid ABC transporter permease [Paracoccus pantotrophus]|uniref:branched-chain amino acid ABC transporter permease n=1 Tax=Paracoccus pantotrophus TaxID=82367 RepID=UPI000492157D|nr:branched-chain amino acid ABC transporter permease [Paracoccus pantotrophus]
MKPVWYLYAAIAVAALYPWLADSRYIFHIATMITIMTPMAFSLGLMLKLGQMSLAQPAFMGIGAYAAALLSMQLGVPTLLSLLIGGVLAALTALATGPVFLRIKGVYFVLLTYAFGQIVFLIFQEWTSLTGGMSGLYGIPKLSVLGWRLSQTQHYYILGLVFTIGCYAALRWIERSNVGAVIQALNEDEMLSRSIGSNAISWRVAAYTLSAFIAGISGGIYAFYIGFLSPDPFGFRGSVDLIVINTIGGTGSILGPLVGAIVVVPLPEVLRDAQQYQLLIYGVCLIVFIMFIKQGLISLGSRRRGGKS